MADSHPFERPQPSEKLSYKFILDCINETREEKEASLASDVHPPIEAEIAAIAEPVQEELPEEMLTTDETAPERTSNYVATPLPPKKYFRIGEVAELIGVEPYVLRYWEGEFHSIRPTKTGSGHRIYARKDVETLQMIRHLLHVEKFSIKGAKKQLAELKKEAKAGKVSTSHVTPQVLKDLSHELKALIQLARTAL